MVHPVDLGVFGIPDLVHDREGVTVVGVYRIVQAHRGADCIQRLTHIGQG